MKLSKFNIAAQDIPENGKCAVYNTLTQGLVVLEDHLLERLKNGEACGLSAQELKSLEESGVLVQEGLDEDRLLDLFHNQMRFSGNTLDITLLTTMSCNFACTYCYEGDLTYGKKHMSPKTADDAVSWITARAKERGVSRVDITYHGGEPLLNISVIERVWAGLSDFCGKKGIRFTSHIVTNGYLLTRKTAKRIRAAGVESAKVTIDGPEEVHDSMRPARGGGGTYRTIIKNLLDVKDILRLSIGGNYTKETAGRIPELLDNLIDAGLGPGEAKRVGFFPVMPVENGGRAAGFDGGCVPTDGLYDNALLVHEEVVKRGFGKHEEPKMNPCPVVVANYFTINYDGSICKCPALADRPGYEVGHVAEEFGYNTEMVRCLGHNTFENERCRNCNVLPLCLGGCRYLALVNKGTFHEIDCRKDFITAMTLEAVRRMALEFKK